MSSRQLTRRGMLGLAGGLGPLSLADCLRSRASGHSTVAGARSVILVWLAGGPSHLETLTPSRTRLVGPAGHSEPWRQRFRECHSVRHSRIWPCSPTAWR